eukprot:2238261-Rhodomonas_salina.2
MEPLRKGFCASRRGTAQCDGTESGSIIKLRVRTNVERRSSEQISSSEAEGKEVERAAWDHRLEQLHLPLQMRPAAPRGA